MMAKRCMFRCVPVLLLALVPACLLSACAAKERSGAEIMSAVISERQTAARYNLNTEWWRGYGLGGPGPDSGTGGQRRCRQPGAV